MHEPTQKPIAFLFPAFPVLHQTFVLWEVLALRERGVPIALFSIKRPSTSTQQPEGEALRHEVHYLPSTLSLPVLRDNLSAFLQAPLRYLGVYRRMVAAWWRDRNVGREWKNRRISESAPDRELTRKEYIQGRFNRSPLLYLLKSLWLVPIAVHLGNLLRASGIDRIHAHWASYPTTVALAAHWMFDIPFSFTAHAYDIYLVPRLLSVKVEESDFAVTCAQVNATFLRSLVSEESGRHVIVNYHGVNLARFRPVQRGGAAVQPCLVTCGRLEPYKGHHVLLRACALLSQPVRCVIVGEGPQRERLEQLATELGIAERVELTGPVPQTRLTEIYAQADLFVLASVILERSGKRDVIPNVLAEAMAMQLPVVATDISGIGELVTDGVSGRLVPPNDAQALANVLGELLADPQQRERLARGGAVKVAAEFDRKENIEALTTLFKRSLTARGDEPADLQTARSSAGRGL